MLLLPFLLLLIFLVPLRFFFSAISAALITFIILMLQWLCRFFSFFPQCAEIIESLRRLSLQVTSPAMKLEVNVYYGKTLYITKLIRCKCRKIQISVNLGRNILSFNE